MHGAFQFLEALTIVLGVAAVVTVVFHRLRQPVVLGYIIAGLIIGPHVPVPLVADRQIVQTLSELGVILLMFSLGLEFSIRKLIQVGPTAGITAVVQHLVTPVRDMFAAVFFVSVGLMIDPSLIARHWGAVALITAVVIAGKILGVTLGAFLTGNGVRTSVQSGMSLAQIGEFSFIIAGLGLTLGVTRDFLYPVAVSVSALTVLSTPWLIRGSSATANFVDRRLPRALQTFAALYGTWLEGLRKAPDQRTRGAAARRLVRLLLIDAFIVTGIAIGTAVSFDRAVELARGYVPVSTAVLRWLVVLAAVGLSLPFVAGLARVGRRLAVLVADAALPEAPGGRTDLALAPRRMLIAAVQLTIVLLVGAAARAGSPAAARPRGARASHPRGIESRCRQDSRPAEPPGAHWGHRARDSQGGRRRARPERERSSARRRHPRPGGYRRCLAARQTASDSHAPARRDRRRRRRPLAFALTDPVAPVRQLHEVTVRRQRSFRTSNHRTQVSPAPRLSRRSFTWSGAK